VTTEERGVVEEEKLVLEGEVTVDEQRRIVIYKAPTPRSPGSETLQSRIIARFGGGRYELIGAGTYRVPAKLGKLRITVERIDSETTQDENE
jgi:hypothetical protein